MNYKGRKIIKLKVRVKMKKKRKRKKYREVEVMIGTEERREIKLKYKRFVMDKKIKAIYYGENH
jgi:hypothetical protein